ncbi:PDZ domain-containing protein [Chengkuizengella marina]|uniref:PDZ domain-containing protein n=1 Tax=Chengkuizengella marina TaxID=2507566 RepID=A0A6N9Q5C7_9BACL|nr:PDZ domain-containing protein [Chengkuizengella marina]NBI29834.1 hypothetical protein [Chengkuizengella marina]
MCVSKKILIEREIEKVFWSIAHIDGITSWLADSGYHESNDELQVRDKFHYQYGNITNTGFVFKKLPPKMIELRNIYKISFNNEKRIMPLRTLFSLESFDENNTLLQVDIFGFHRNYGKNIKDIFDYTYNKVLLNLKSVNETGIDCRKQLFKENNLGILFTEKSTDNHKQCITISQIKKGTLAEKINLKPHDIIEQINGMKVNSYKEFSRLMDCSQFKLKDLIIKRENERKILYMRGEPIEL